MRRRALILAVALAMAGAAQAQTCRSHHQWAKNTFAPQVQRLQTIETQVLQRYTGRPGPSYGELARAIHLIGDTITQGPVTEMERALRGCRNFVPPYRRVCGAAAFALLGVVSEISAGNLSESTRMTFAERMDRCELWLGFPRRDSLLRMP